MADTTTKTFHLGDFLQSRQSYSRPTGIMLFQQLLSYMCSFIIPRSHLRIKPAPVYEPVSYDNFSRKPEDGCCPSSSPIEGSEVCCVCLSRLKEESEDVRALPCAHMFHRVCIDRWLDVCPRTCPLCRFSMDEEGAGGVGVITDEMVIWFSSFHA